MGWLFLGGNPNYVRERERERRERGGESRTSCPTLALCCVIALCLLQCFVSVLFLCSI
jgi:hypothetical protein